VTRITVSHFLADRLPDLDLLLPGDIDVTAQPPATAGWPALLPLNEAVAAAVAREVAGGRRPVVLSGDCCTALGAVAGLQRCGVDPAIVWLDAHGDVQTMETTSSGFIGGMPLRILVGYRPELIAEGLGLRPVPEKRVVLVDARDLDPPERTYLRAAEIVHIELGELSAGVLPAGPVYLHVDVDVVDPAELPGLRYPAPAGPVLADVAAAVERVLTGGDVVAVGIACTWSEGIRANDDVRALFDMILRRWEGRAARLP
jgi:arginase